MDCCRVGTVSKVVIFFVKCDYKEPIKSRFLEHKYDNCFSNLFGIQMSSLSILAINLPLHF